MLRQGAVGMPLGRMAVWGRGRAACPSGRPFPPPPLGFSWGLALALDSCRPRPECPHPLDLSFSCLLPSSLILYSPAFFPPSFSLHPSLALALSSFCSLPAPPRSEYSHLKFSSSGCCSLPRKWHFLFFLGRPIGLQPIV